MSTYGTLYLTEFSAINQHAKSANYYLWCFVDLAGRRLPGVTETVFAARGFVFA
jgi:hypothetical protein